MNQGETNKRICRVCGGRGAVSYESPRPSLGWTIQRSTMPCMNCTGGFVTAPSDADKSAPKETK